MMSKKHGSGHQEDVSDPVSVNIHWAHLAAEIRANLEEQKERALGNTIEERIKPTTYGTLQIYRRGQ